MAGLKTEALVTYVENGTAKLVKKSIPAPVPGKHQLLVKVSHVAQNPTDVLSLDANAFGDGAVLGCDFVGVVEAVGSDVTRFAKGTTVAGLIWGGEEKGLGAYSQYTLADKRICFPLPSGISAAEASTVPLASCTALLALFSKGSLAINADEKPAVLIWGGSSSVGLYAIQIARLHGLSVLTTCSPKNFDSVAAHGATAVFDYHDPHVIDKIRTAAPDLKYIFDTIGNPVSSELAARAISVEHGGLCTVRPGKLFTKGIRPGIKVSDVLVWTAFLKAHQYKEFLWPANPEDHALAAAFFEKLPELLQSGVIKPNNTKVLHGLDAVSAGFQEYRDGKISNYKIVYEL